MFDNTPAAKLGNRRSCKPRMDCCSAEADQTGNMVDIARLSRLYNNACAVPAFLPDKFQENSRDCEEGWNCNQFSRELAVRKDDDFCAFIYCFKSSPAEQRNGCSKIFVITRISDRYAHCSETAPGLDLTDIPFKEKRRGDAVPPGMIGCLAEKTAARSQMHGKGHDHLLPNGIDRRIGDLGKALLEIAEEQRRLLRKGWQRGVVSHRESQLCCITRHGCKHGINFLGRIAKGDLLCEYGAV